VAVNAEGLCMEKEVALFNCEMKKSVSSLCLATENGDVTYRNGIDGRLDFMISEDKNIKKRIFYFSDVSYAGGGEAHIRFSRFGYTYYLYDKTIKADDGPEFSAGVAVYKGLKRVSNSLCINDASIRSGAYQSIEREVFKAIDVK
jgi:hypothetical protein